LPIALLAVSLDKRKKEWVLVKNKDDNKRIFKITQKGKTKIFGEYYCNIPLANPNQFEIKKCKKCSKNAIKMTEKFDEEACISHFSWNKILEKSCKKHGKQRAGVLLLHRWLFAVAEGGLELAAICLVVLLASSSTKLTIYSDSMVAIDAVTSINHFLAFSQFIKLENFRLLE
ncbi:13660_t:CDS:2, partial [Gigaspora margarita]